MSAKRLIFSLRGTEDYVDGATFADADMALVPLSTVVLNLELSAVTDAGMDRLPTLSKLRCLDLDGTRITDLTLKRLSAQSQLEELWLEQTAVTDAGLNPDYSRGGMTKGVPIG
jgi:hypothetical protein